MVLDRLAHRARGQHRAPEPQREGSRAAFQGVDCRGALSQTMVFTQRDAARLLTYRGIKTLMRGERGALEAAMAKLYASEIAVQVADDCVQIHGGYGFVKDYPAERFFRDVKLTTIGEGTSEIQRLVIARQLLARV